MSLASMALAQSAFAMSARECRVEQRELAETVQALQVAQAELVALGEQAELAGDEYVAAQEVSSLSADHAAEATRLEAEFDALRGEVEAKNASLAAQAAEFTSARTLSLIHI